jgi:tRNA pseudouridine38-40 synthase
MTQRFLRITFEYDGTRYAGWQIQPGQRTVQGEVERALGVLLRHPVRVRVAGRTDAGVHAFGQVCTLRTEQPVEVQPLLRGLNGVMPKDIAAVAVEEVAPQFDARHDARGKHYRYRILNRRARSAVDRARCWHVWQPLDHGAMEQALGHLRGTHDFRAFRAADCSNKQPIKELREASLTVGPRSMLELDFVGSGFLKQMVRILVGTVVEVGRGARAPGGIPELLASHDRTLAGRTAPAQGLFLVRVFYDDEAEGRGAP